MRDSELLLLHIERVSCGRLGKGPRPGHARVSLGWLGNTFWMRGDQGERSCLGLDCCPCDLDKQQKIDGWMELLSSG